MLDLCLFDLDNTLLRTDDLADIRPQGVGKQEDAAYAAELLGRFGNPVERHIYTPQHLAALKAQWPKVKFGIFTRSPQAYAVQLARLAFPNFHWDIGAVYETVPQGFHKPNGWGIRWCMNAVGVADPQRVVMVGDETVDVKAAYNAGCRVVLDKTSWPERWDGQRENAIHGFQARLLLGLWAGAIRSLSLGGLRQGLPLDGRHEHGGDVFHRV